MYRFSLRLLLAVLASAMLSGCYGPGERTGQQPFTGKTP